MDKQKPPDSAGKLTGFPYRENWEEFGEPWERFYNHGIDRDLIHRAFARARKQGRRDLCLTKTEVCEITGPLGLSARRNALLADQLYYFAGHYYWPWFHKMDGDSPAEVRKLMKSMAATAGQLERQLDRVTPALWRHVDVARWALGEHRRAGHELEWSPFRDQIADLARAARTLAEEFPQFGRGTTEKVLLGRWLRQSAEAIELATGNQIRSKTSDSAGRNHRFEGAEGTVFEKYCKRIDKGLATRTLVAAVRSYQRHGIAGMPPKSGEAGI
jgi:hypothetical protein